MNGVRNLIVTCSQLRKRRRACVSSKAVLEPDEVSSFGVLKGIKEPQAR
jgi:hypothetical protein